jgi:hypothetical protein
MISCGRKARLTPTRRLVGTSVIRSWCLTARVATHQGRNRRTHCGHDVEAGYCRRAMQGLITLAGHASP